MVTTLAIQSGTTLATEQLQYSIPCVGSSNGICPCTCNYATDAGCTCRDLKQAMNVVITKTPVVATYPLTYRQSFNYKPYELVLKVGAATCVDGSQASSPTCGWAYDYSNNKIFNSQGFCCSCSLAMIVANTLGASTQGSRTNLNCNLLQTGIALYSSASCLRYDALWYEGYDVQESSLQFTINVTVTMPKTADPNDTSTTTEVLSLTPSTPLVLSSSQLIRAELLGDLTSYTSLPVFTSKMLMIPHPTGMGPEQVLNYNKSTWMMIDKTLISLDGTECNKVGTGYDAFKLQDQACKQLPGTCLAGQLKALATADNALIAAGRTPQYYLSAWGGGNLTNQVTQKTSGQLVLNLPIPNSIRNSIIVLSVTADNLRYTVNSSPGKILSAKVCTFNNVSCGTFEALTDRGYLQVEVQNSGHVDASYTITVSKCSEGITPPDAQTASMASQASSGLTFLIYMTSDQAVTNNNCTLAIQNSQGAVTDTKVVVFATNATQYSDQPQQSAVQGSTAGSANPTYATCATKCPGWYNVICFLLKGCWGLIFKFFGILLAILLGISLIWAGITRGWFAAAFNAWLKMLGRPSRHRARDYAAGAESADDAPPDGAPSKEKEKGLLHRMFRTPGEPAKDGREASMSAGVLQPAKAATAAQGKGRGKSDPFMQYNPMASLSQTGSDANFAPPTPDFHGGMSQQRLLGAHASMTQQYNSGLFDADGNEMLLDDSSMAGGSAQGSFASAAHRGHGGQMSGFAAGQKFDGSEQQMYGGGGYGYPEGVQGRGGRPSPLGPAGFPQPRQVGNPGGQGRGRGRVGSLPGGRGPAQGQFPQQPYGQQFGQDDEPQQNGFDPQQGQFQRGQQPFQGGQGRGRVQQQMGRNGQLQQSWQLQSDRQDGQEEPYDPYSGAEWQQQQGNKHMERDGGQQQVGPGTGPHSAANGGTPQRPTTPLQQAGGPMRTGQNAASARGAPQQQQRGSIQYPDTQNGGMDVQQRRSIAPGAPEMGAAGAAALGTAAQQARAGAGRGQQQSQQQQQQPQVPNQAARRGSVEAQAGPQGQSGRQPFLQQGPGQQGQQYESQQVFQQQGAGGFNQQAGAQRQGGGYASPVGRQAPTQQQQQQYGQAGGFGGGAQFGEQEDGLFQDGDAEFQDQPDVEGQLVELLQGVAQTGVAFLDLAQLGPGGVPDLAAPGPSACLAGEVTLMEDPQGGGSYQVLWSLANGREAQLVAFNAARRAYARLSAPRPLDADSLAIVLAPEVAVRAMSLAPLGVCLN